MLSKTFLKPCFPEAMKSTPNFALTDFLGNKSAFRTPFLRAKMGRDREEDVGVEGVRKGKGKGMGKSEMTIIVKAEELVKSAMESNDASHDAAHAYRVRDLALSLASEEGFSSSPHSMLIVELAALLHDIGDYKYMRDLSEGKIVEDFLVKEEVDESIVTKILNIINGMGFKEEIGGPTGNTHHPEFGVVQDADRLDAIGAIGIARCFTFGGSRNRVLHDPNIKPRADLSKEKYMNKDEQTTVNHFHEKLLKLKELMKTKAGKRRAERRHKFMEDFLEEFYEEWDGRA